MRALGVIRKLDNTEILGIILITIAAFAIGYQLWKRTRMQAPKPPEYDFTLEVPAPVETLARTDALINKLVQRLDDPNVPRLTIDEEADLQMSLFGLGRMIEVNVRIAWEVFATNEGLPDTSPTAYKHVLNLSKKHFQPIALHDLFKSAMTITDGLVHGNFYQAFNRAKLAYKRDDFGLTQDIFHSQTIVETKVTGKGVTVDAKTGVATTSDGEPLEHKSYVPNKHKPINEDFESFVASGGFVPIYDVLKTAYTRAYHTRKCIEAGKK